MKSKRITLTEKQADRIAYLLMVGGDVLESNYQHGTDEDKRDPAYREMLREVKDMDKLRRILRKKLRKEI